MQQTTNYNLKKIELTDSPPDITVINPNWDTIDTTMNSLAEQLDEVTEHTITTADCVNGWITYSGFCYAIKNNKTVILSMYIRDGVTTRGTTITTLPAGFRPAQKVLATVASYNGSSAVSTGIVVIYTSGEVKIDAGWTNSQAIIYLSYITA